MHISWDILYRIHDHKLQCRGKNIEFSINNVIVWVYDGLKYNLFEFLSDTSFNFAAASYTYLAIYWSDDRPTFVNHRYNYHIYWASGPVFRLLLGVSSDYAQPITGQVTEVTCPVIGRAQPELTPSKRQKTGPGLTFNRGHKTRSDVVDHEFNAVILLSREHDLLTAPFFEIRVQHGFEHWGGPHQMAAGHREGLILNQQRHLVLNIKKG